METNAIIESLKFMILGMGVVYAFLIVMIYAIKIQAKIIAKYFPMEEKKPNLEAKRNPSSTLMAKKVAAIVAVIHHNTHTNDKNNE